MKKNIKVSSEDYRDISITEINNSLLHDIKYIALDIVELRAELVKLQEHIVVLNMENQRITEMMDDLYDFHQNRIKVPHRCPICHGLMLDDKEEMCIPCDGTGLVWG